MISQSDIPDTTSLRKMAKEKSTDKEERRREKAVKKEKRSEKDGVHKSKKPDKKEKKLAAAAEDIHVTTKLLNNLEDQKPGSVAVKVNGAVEVKVKSAPLLGALVPFANPLADEKVGKKVLKSVKKGKHASLCWSQRQLTFCLSSCQKQISETRRQRSR